MHNYYPHDSEWVWLDKIGQQVLFKMADAVTIHQKGKQLKLASKHKNKNIVFIPHGNYVDAYGLLSGHRVEMRHKFNFKEDDIVMLSLGAVKPYKKTENIITALKTAGSEQVKLLIVGKCDKQYAENLKNVISGEDNIELICDFVPDEKIPDYLAMADHSIFWYDDSVLTSGGIILSLSYGVPVIARNISAADLIENGKNGFLFNDEKELTEIIKKLPGMPKFERDRVISTVSHLSWDKVSEEFIKLYESL